jgi:hypothetical protein
MAIWKPRSTTLSKKHIVQSFGPSKLNLMQSLGYLFISSVFICLINIVFISSESLCVIIVQDKESLITELRKELRVSDEEHRELLSRVNADDIIRRIRSEYVGYILLSSFHLACIDL